MIRSRGVCPKLLAQPRDRGNLVSTTSKNTFWSWMDSPKEKGSEVGKGKVSYSTVAFIRVIVRIALQHFATSV